MNRDYFGNLVDDEGHDILEDEYDEELADLDELDDDFPFGLEYEEEYYEESYLTGDSDLANEY